MIKSKLILIAIILIIILIPVVPTSKSIQGIEEFSVFLSEYPNTPSEIKRISENQKNIIDFFEKEKQVILESNDWKFMLEYDGFSVTKDRANVTHYEDGLPFIKRSEEVVSGVYPVFIANYFEKKTGKNISKKIYLISEFVEGIDYSEYITNSNDLIPKATEYKIGNINIINRKTHIFNKSGLVIKDGEIKDSYVINPQNGLYSQMFDAEIFIDIEYAAIIQNRVSIAGFLITILENRPEIIGALAAIFGVVVGIFTLINNVSVNKINKRLDEADRKIENLSQDIGKIKTNVEETSSPQDENNK